MATQEQVVTTDAAPEPATEVVVRAYGLLPPLDWSEAAEEELRLQTRLWNALVEIERTHRDAVRALTPPEAADDLHALQARRAELVAERKARRAAARSRIATPDLDEQIAALKPLVAEAAARAKQAGRNAREAQRDTLRQLELDRRAGVKRARQSSGLYWGNYNAVVDSYEAARQRALKTGGELHYRRHDGGGRITNQIQGGMTVAELQGGEHAQARVTGAGRRRTLTVTVRTDADPDAPRGRRRTEVSWPLIWHRDIPDDARIKQVVVTRRRIGAHWRWRAVVTATRAAEPVEAIGPAVALDLGFRRVPEGVRVATWLREGERRARHVVLPEAVLDGLAHCDAIRSRRDGMLAAAVAQLRALPKGAPAELDALLQPIRQAPKIGFGRVAQLAFAWRGHDWRPADRTALEAWRKADKRLWLEEVNLRDKLTARRLDLYRCAAREVLHGAGALVLDRLDLAQAAKVEPRPGEENALPPAARAYRHAAAPGEFRLVLTQAAAKLGVPVQLYAAGSTQVCHACGAEPAGDPSDLRLRCSGCGVYWDQDENACRVMLTAAPPRAVRPTAAFSLALAG